MRSQVLWHIVEKINENFENDYYQVQKAHNIHKWKICEHKCNKIATKYKTEENGKI